MLRLQITITIANMQFLKAPETASLIENLGLAIWKVNQ